MQCWEGRLIHIGLKSLWPHVTHSRATVGICPSAGDAGTGLRPAVSLGAGLGLGKVTPWAVSLAGFCDSTDEFHILDGELWGPGDALGPPMGQAWLHIGHHMGSPALAGSWAQRVQTLTIPHPYGPAMGPQDRQVGGRPAAKMGIRCMLAKQSPVHPPHGSGGVSRGEGWSGTGTPQGVRAGVSKDSSISCC